MLINEEKNTWIQLDLSKHLAEHLMHSRCSVNMCQHVGLSFGHSSTLLHYANHILHPIPTESETLEPYTNHRERDGKEQVDLFYCVFN